MTDKKVKDVKKVDLNEILLGISDKIQLLDDDVCNLLGHKVGFLEENQLLKDSITALQKKYTSMDKMITIIKHEVGIDRIPSAYPLNSYDLSKGAKIKRKLKNR